MATHSFEDQEFSNFTKCFICDELIAQEIVDGIYDNVPTGIKDYVPDFLTKQLPRDKGCTCSSCGLNVHKKCQHLVDTECEDVEHRFEIRSYTPLATMCAACGTGLQGLYRQGYRCITCGIDVHPGCRTNLNIRKCAAVAHEASQVVHAKPKQDDVPVFNPVFEEDEEDRNLPSNRRRRRKKKKENVKLHIADIVIPSNIGGIGKELMKIHTQSRALSVVAEEKWTQVDRPRLIASRRNLRIYQKKLMKASKAREGKVNKISRARKTHYDKILKKLKKKEEERKRLLASYSGLYCDEIEMFKRLKEEYPSGNALKIIQKELGSEPYLAKELEAALQAYEEIRKEQATVTSALEAVRREIFFPRYNHWFARIAVEGKYAALGQLWVESIMGALAIRVAMIPRKKKPDTLIPTVVVALCGPDTPVNISQMGVTGSKEHKRHTLGTKGAQLKARVESLSVSERNLGVSFVLDEVNVDFEIFLNMEMEFITRKKNPRKGKWALKPNTFTLKFEKFGLTFKAGALQLPDAVLQLVIRNILTSAIKEGVNSMLSPDLGFYMHKMHKYREAMKNPGEAVDFEQFRFYAKADIKADLPLDALMFNFQSIKNAKKKNEKSQKKFDQALKAVTRVLGLDENQLELLIRTQEEIALTKTNAFPDESIRSLGLKAIQTLNVQGALENNDVSAINVQGIVEAANKIGLKVISGELISENPPLLTILDIVRYIRTYFGERADEYFDGDVFAPRIAALWQGALDAVAKKMGKGTFAKRIFRAASSKEVGKGGGIRIDFLALIDRIRKLNGKKLLTSVEVVDVDLKLGLRGLLDVAEAKALSAGKKSSSGGAMLFELRQTQLDEEDDEEFDINFEKNLSLSKDLSLNEYDTLEENETSTNFGGLLTGLNSKVTDDNSDSFTQAVREEDDIVLVSSRNVKGQKALLESERAIKNAFAETHDRLTYLHEKLFNSLQLQINGFVGDGSFDVEASQIETRIDNEFRLRWKSTLFGYSRRDNSWPWRRLVRATDAGMEAVVVHVDQRADKDGPERLANPETQDTLNIAVSKMEGTLVQSEKGKPMKVKLTPSAEDSNVNSWQEPGHVHLDFEAPGLSFEGSIPFMRISGGLQNIHDYAADLLQWKLKALNYQESRQKAQLALLRKLMTYALLNTFNGSLSANVEVQSTDDEIFCRCSRSSQFPDEKIVTMTVENDFVQFTDDVAHLLDQFRVDPLAKN